MIDFTRFRRPFKQTSLAELSEITTESLIEILNNVDSLYPPLDLDYNSLMLADRSHAALGDYLSTLVGMYDRLIIELMQKGMLEESDRMISLNDKNRPYHRAFVRRGELESFKGYYEAAKKEYENMFNDIPARYDPYSFESRSELGRNMLSMAFTGDMGERYSEYPSPYSQRMNGWDDYVKNLVEVPGSETNVIFSVENFGSYTEFQKFVIFYSYNGLRLDFDDFPAVQKFFSTISSYDDNLKGLESIQDDCTEFYSLCFPD